MLPASDGVTPPPPDRLDVVAGGGVDEVRPAAETAARTATADDIDVELDVVDDEVAAVARYGPLTTGSSASRRRVPSRSNVVSLS